MIINFFGVAVVTNDNHFNEVRKLNFPIVNIITAEIFLEILATL